MEKDIFEDIEIIDDFEEETQEEEQLLETESWLSDFTQSANDDVVDNVDNSHIEPQNDEMMIIDVDSLEINNEESTAEKEVITKEASNDINNNIVSNLVEPLEEEVIIELDEKEQEIEEIESKRSLLFIGFLFGTLIIVIILLPLLSKWFGK